MPDFRFEGPPTLIVALQRLVESGEVVKGAPDALRASAGFHELEKPAKKSEPKGDD